MLKLLLKKYNLIVIFLFFGGKMKKLLKLLLLLLLNISVYFIYNSTKNSVYTITSLGDGVSLGINSYAIDDYSYADYYKDFSSSASPAISGGSFVSSKRCPWVAKIV